MKTFPIPLSIFIILFLFSINSNANWLKKEIQNSFDSKKTTPQTKYTQDFSNTNSYPLPEGVTKDWLNSLRDENGNNVIPQNPEFDAMQQLTFTGSATGDIFGYSVALAGDVNNDGFDDIIMGAPYNDAAAPNAGRAYIYYGGINMDTIADVILTGESQDNYFGTVSGAGDVNGDGYSDVIVGAYGYSSIKGRAYIFFGGSSMNNLADVTMTGEAINNEFGISVSGGGDVNGDGFSDVIIGAQGYSSSTGRAYIFLGGTIMNNVADVIMNGESAGNNFGCAVSISGDANDDDYTDIVIGAFGYSSNTGRAYIYYGGSAMNNVVDVTLTGEATVNYFGISVSGAGDVNGDGFSDVLIGAQGYATSTGRACIYYGGNAMNNVADVIMTGETSATYFGYSVSAAGDVNGDGYADVMVGAYGYSSSKGKAYIFYGGNAMNNVADVSLTGGGTNEFFGISVSGGGDLNGDGYSDVITGAYGYSSNRGRAYLNTNIYSGEAVPDFIATGESIYNNFGFSLSGAGDVNNDGYSDVIVGAPSYNSWTGRAYIYYGGAVINNVADVIITGGAANDEFGISVSGAGDINGDGYSDVIVGADGYNSYSGTAYIFYGGAAMNSVADIFVARGGVNNYFGRSVSGAGDVNGDGYSDVIVGAFGYSSFTGRAYIYYGGAVFNNVADVIMTGDAANNNFGVSVSGAGDVNSDGYSDVIVGANGADFLNTGASYIYFGDPAMNNVADVTMTGQSPFNYFGISVSGAGDVNGDKYSDVIVGAYNIGRAYIFYGGALMDNISDVVLSDEVSGDQFGFSVSRAGDVNDDGYSDVIVGARGYSSNTGRAYVFYGSAVMNNISDLIMAGGASGDYFGFSVSGAGDVNGDGHSDVIIGATQPNLGNGRAYIYQSFPPPLHGLLNLKMIMEGFYDAAANNMRLKDTAKVYFRNSSSPYAIVDSSKGEINQNTFTGLFTIKNAPAGNYYVTVKHRNTIETWSNAPISYILSGTINYDFTNASSQAYGNNLKQVDSSPLRFAIYSGDSNQDGIIDVSDLIDIYNDVNILSSGYLSTDINGDAFVDVSDLILTYNNSLDVIGVITP